MINGKKGKSKKEQFTFFWKGPFSQWFPSKFHWNELDWTCAEQYMMAMKAYLFQDEETFNKIRKTTDPREHKKLGRQVKKFDLNKWNENAKDIVYIGNYQKFIQNHDLKMKLLNTKGTTLVEASPYDKIWGIGLSQHDARCMLRKQWLGTNWLGEILTKVRNDIEKQNN